MRNEAGRLSPEMKEGAGPFPGRLGNLADRAAAGGPNGKQIVNLLNELACRGPKLWVFVFRVNDADIQHNLGCQADSCRDIR